jgi:hypothetical protein
MMSASNARQLGLEVGDEFSLHAASFADCLGRPTCETMPAGTGRLTGLVLTDQEFAPDPNGWITLLAGPAAVADDTARLAASASLTYLWVAEDASTDDLVAEYADRIDNGDIGNETSSDDGVLASASRMVHHERNAVLIASSIAAIAGLLITGQTYSRHLARRRSDVPTMLAIGMTGAQRTAAAAIPGIAAAMIGAACAAPVALALSPLFPLRTARRADPDVGWHADTPVLIAGVALTLMLGVGAVVVGAWRWNRRPLAGDVSTVSLGARIAAVLRLTPAPAMGTRYALERSVGHERLPSLAAVSTGIAAVVAATAASVLATNIDTVRTQPESYGVTWDVAVGTGPDPAAARAYVHTDPRLATATLVRAGELQLTVPGEATRTTSVVGTEDLLGAFRWTVVDGRPPTGPGEAVLIEPGMRGLGLGDQVTMSGPTGSRLVEIVGTVVLPSDGAGPPAELVTDLALVEELGGPDLIAATDAERTVLLTTTDPADVDAVVADLEEFGARPERPVEPIEVSLLDEIRFIPYIVTGFVVALATFTTFHALWTTSRRRRRELMVMRTFGARPRDAASVARWQGVTMSVVAVIAGLPLGLAAGRWIWSIVLSDRIFAPTVAVNWEPIVVIALVTLVGVPVVLAAIPAQENARRRPAAELRTE